MQTPVHFVGVNAIIMQDNRVLLLRRSGGGYGSGSYCLPGGHVDGNEAIVQALAREVCEEVGITVNPQDLEFAHVSHSRGSGREYVSFYFIVRSWQGELCNKEPDRHDEMAWFSLDALPENFLGKVAINAWYKQKKTYSESGW